MSFYGSYNRVKSSDCCRGCEITGQETENRRYKTGAVDLRTLIEVADSARTPRFP